MIDKVELTDSEWMSLIDGSEERRGLTSCCANISHLRDVIMSIARGGGHIHIGFEKTQLEYALGAAEDGHELTNIPALVKLREQLGLTDVSHIREAMHETFR